MERDGDANRMNQVKNIISRYENTRDIVILIARIILGIVFIYASFEKIIDPLTMVSWSWELIFCE